MISLQDTPQPLQPAEEINSNKNFLLELGKYL